VSNRTAREVHGHTFGSEVVHSFPPAGSKPPPHPPQRRGHLPGRIPGDSERRPRAFAHDGPLAVIELPELLRNLDEPLTPGELNRLRHRTDPIMVVAWWLFALVVRHDPGFDRVAAPRRRHRLEAV
jgi:hypothetical protein